ncbi:aldehyde dehydrogenase (NAD+) [Streptosporangium becharense]|uniref:Aldehyde dehydrogenase (NAD+) n=1 Tax=Streptosporangium becharense TaxID=1816182 RepID=A0A7W9MEG1_9ACTN|nr:aldehyde dehydrogenase family protein [Streptosporangium becharense]MBB2915224.1 aldehyde dehydrogenase (NAD+) [Streptosporangium becharense]MBB5817947.1 aldehyde dehydrogenase (NAD+) [Streptosporangium becharense]
MNSVIKLIESRSPHAPSDVVASFPAAGEAGVHAAVRLAQAVQHDWAGRNAAARAAALAAAADAVEGAADELAALVVREVGKPVTEARAEVARSVSILRYHAQQVFDPAGAVHEPSGSGLLFTRRRPLGVAGLITPWNFPLAIPLWKAAPALAFGNTVVLKPAPQALACALRLAELLNLNEFQVVPGDAEEGAVLVETADVVSFSGSARAGAPVRSAAARRGVPVQAEMGGQNAALVLPDANLEAAAAQIAAAAMGFAGQKCTATKRVIAVGNGDEVREAVLAAVGKLACGDPSDPGTVVGPLIDEAARDRVVAAAGSAARAGGRILAGGRAVRGPGADGGGWYVEPTVVDGLPAGHPLLCEEVFGPICAIQDAGSVDEAVALANGVRYGLASAVYTTDLDRALDVSDRLETGLVKVNAPTSGVDFHLPFGGEKDSGYGAKEQGKAAQEFYTSLRTVTIAPAG